MSTKKLNLVLTVITVVLSFTYLAQTKTVSAAAALCYGQGTNSRVVKLPVCDYSKLKAIGLVMTGLPNPLAANDCYYWTKDGNAGKRVNCAETVYNKAPNMTAADASSASTTQPTTTGSNASIDVSRKEVTNCNGKGNSVALQDCLKKNPLVTRFNDLINFLGIGVGVIVVIMIIVGGIQYTTAGSNPQAVSAAKKRILNAVSALVAFLLLYAFMQWLIPGGPF